MKLIVGLGNPGIEYKYTRHNMGFLSVLYIKDKLNLPSFKSKFNGEYIQTKVDGNDCIFLLPTTYMNNSGMSIIQFVNYFKIDLNDILVIYDDIDIDFLKLRLKPHGNPGTHNGMKSITNSLSSKEFKRLRIGIGKPNLNQDMADFVLSKFSKEEMNSITLKMEDVYDCVKLFINDNFDAAMNKYNGSTN